MCSAADASPATRAVAWGGALAFAASLGYFLLSYGVTFGRPVPDGPRAAAAAVNAGLFSLFALHHSVFARLRVRAAVARAVPPALERSLYVWVASALFAGVIAAWQPVPGMAWQAVGAWRWLLFALQAAGLGLALRGAAALDVFELAGVRQLSAHQRPAVFKTAGPYGWVRHPIYTGWILLVCCAPAMTMTRLVFAVVSSAYLLIAIPFEERTLRAGGGDYARYARQVRWKLFPGIF